MGNKLKLDGGVFSISRTRMRQTPKKASSKVIMYKADLRKSCSQKGKLITIIAQSSTPAQTLRAIADILEKRSF